LDSASSKPTEDRLVTPYFITSRAKNP